MGDGAFKQKLVKKGKITFAFLFGRLDHLVKDLIDPAKAQAG
jgi:hypothetical protein